MSGLVDKVKEVVRNRSRSRKSNSVGEYDGRNSTDVVRKSGDYTNRDSLNETRTARNRDPVDNLHSTTNDFEGMNLNDSQPSKTLPPLPPDAARNVHDASLQQREAEAERAQQGQGYSPTSGLHRKKFSRPENDYMDNSAISPRKSSGVARKPVGGTAIGNSTSMLADGSSAMSPANYDGANPTTLGSNGTAAAQHRRQPSSPMSGQHTAHPKLIHSAVIRDHPHLRLPEHFDLGHSEHTEVSTTYQPAVTHESVIVPVTEIRQKAIHRDVHVDHYHHYIQPVTVREVHPAVHYSLNHETGERTRIEPPPGFQLPAEFTPTDPKLTDHSHLRKMERHYVVDEANPRGQIEDPPLHSRRNEEMRREEEEYTARYTQEAMRNPPLHPAHHGLGHNHNHNHNQNQNQGFTQDSTLTQNQTQAQSRY